MITLLNMTTLNERLKQVVAEKGLTVKEARAELMRRGMSRSNLSHWFGGRAVEPMVKTAAPAADFFGVDVLWLVKGEGTKRPKKEKSDVNVKLMQLSEETVEFAVMYEAMEPHVRELVRKHARDMNEAIGAPGPHNPFGKGPKQGKKALKKKKRQPGTH